MVFKAVNDIVGSDCLIPTLLVFGAYPCIVTDLPALLSQQQQAYVLAKVIS